LNHIWLTLNAADLETERLQCEQEGKDIGPLLPEIERLIALGDDLSEPERQREIEALLDRTAELPVKAGYPYHEPSGLEEIRAARPQSDTALAGSLPRGGELEDKLHGAWTGRCAGCLLGKPVEGWRSERMWGLLKDAGHWPLRDYFRWEATQPEIRDRYKMRPDRCWADTVQSMPEDDDTNYTTCSLAILERFGCGFAPADVAEFWLQNLPVLHTCTAERVAYRNLVNQIPPPSSAAFRNPYREWIGAQIRGDFWGYVCPGDPAGAAELAWRDASVSHLKNGIYGEMWVAAMTAAAFVTDDLGAMIRAGLGQIPAKCRLASEIERVMDLHEAGCDYDTVVRNLHDLWDEKRAHDWCHTISNAMIVAIALLWGERHFGKTICRAVQACFDTDCNGATTGSILGILHGRRDLPNAWTAPIGDTLETGVAGFHKVNLAEMTQRTMRLIETRREGERA
jgi:hypothetical protein